MSILFYIIMHKINKTTPDKQHFLQRLATIDKTPKFLWYIGSLPEDRVVTVAIVGTRKPTTYGIETTRRFSYELAKRGVVIISGLALGIDGIAHESALEAGGVTIAVLPTSLDSIHPCRHRALAKRIIDNGGALISEYPPGDITQRWNFIRRNRIVAGLSDAVLITEASSRSGTISTANFALSQGNPIMAVPGNITQPMSSGCNNLIRAGAVPITELKDILNELDLQPSSNCQLPLAYTPEEAVIIQLLSSGLRDGDAIQMQSKLAPAVFNQTLSLLELEGKIRPLGANHWTLS